MCPTISSSVIHYHLQKILTFSQFFNFLLHPLLLWLLFLLLSSSSSSLLWIIPMRPNRWFNDTVGINKARKIRRSSYLLASHTIQTLQRIAKAQNKYLKQSSSVLGKPWRPFRPRKLWLQQSCPFRWNWTRRGCRNHRKTPKKEEKRKKESAI